MGERLGRAGAARPPGPLVWLHGASIGEALALTPLFAPLAERATLLLTTGTVTGAAVVAPRLASGALHQFAPLDLPGAVSRFLDHWRPDALLLAESELWPNTIGACHKRGVPVCVVNARLSERSFRRWRWAARSARDLFGRLALCLAQSPDHAARFAALGAPCTAVTGNLKWDAPAPWADGDAFARLRAALGSRPVLLGVSTHPGEEAMLLDAHCALRARWPTLLTILAPRDIGRGGRIARLAAERGLDAGLRSAQTAIGPTCDVLVADSVGEMGLWLGVATIAVVGKTFGRGGGQNPLEAAKSRVPLVHGPSTFQFEDVFASLGEAGGAIALSDPASLSAVLEELLADPARRVAIARRAARAVDALGGAAARTLAALAPLLPAPAPNPH